LTTGSPPANTPNPTYTLRAQRNVVIVRVIVRDRNGKAVAGLHKEDFRLFDDKGPQTIDGFSVDSPGVKASPVASSPRVPPAAAAPAAGHAQATDSGNRDARRRGGAPPRYCG